MGRRVALSLSFALALAALVVSGASATRTTSLKLTVNGTGTVKVGKKSVSCRKPTCRVKLKVAVGARVKVTAKPATLWKFGSFSGACKGTAAKCSFRAKRSKSLAVAFIAPGARTNPIPLGTPWKLPGNWTFTVEGSTPNAAVTEYDTGTPLTPPPGAEFFMSLVKATYTGGGSSTAELLAENFGFEGSHNAAYDYFDDEGCGPQSDAVLPAPDLQPMIMDGTPVYSGQTISGHICLQIAANDQSSLLFDYQGFTTVRVDTWFALG